MNRRLPPRLIGYRPRLASTLSILYRISGVALAFGAVALAWWLIAMAMIAVAIGGDALAGTAWL